MLQNPTNDHSKIRRPRGGAPPRTSSSADSARCSVQQAHDKQQQTKSGVTGADKSDTLLSQSVERFDAGPLAVVFSGIAWNFDKRRRRDALPLVRRTVRTGTYNRCRLETRQSSCDCRVSLSRCGQSHGSSLSKVLAESSSPT